MVLHCDRRVLEGARAPPPSCEIITQTLCICCVVLFIDLSCSKHSIYLDCQLVYFNRLLGVSAYTSNKPLTYNLRTVMVFCNLHKPLL